MPIFKEIPPTAGWAFSPRDLAAFFSKPKCSNLESDFKGYLNVPYARLTYSGTAALYMIFESIKKLSPRRTVVMPSYVCPLVALAATRAQLKIEVCDINKNCFDYDCGALEKVCERNKDIAAIVIVHLGGIPICVDKIISIAKKCNILTIEDCAHALGAEYIYESDRDKQKKCGGFGDFSFFSLCRGKGLSIYEGGILVVNNKKYIVTVDAIVETMARKNYLSEAFKIFELFGYWLFYRPQLFWFVFKLPQIFWKVSKKEARAFGEEYDTGFDIHKVSGMRNRLGHISFYRLEKEIAGQRSKALYYIKELGGLRGITIIQENTGSRATYPFLVLLFNDSSKRDLALKRLERLGVGVSLVYLNPICDYNYLKETFSHCAYENASYLSKRQLTLSTNSFLKNKDLKTVTEVLKEIAASQ